MAERLQKSLVEIVIFKHKEVNKESETYIR